MLKKILIPVSLLLALPAPACNSYDDGGTAAQLTLDFEKYTLDNGLEVVLHVDRSDPIAAVAMTFHVGSAREVAGRTGFAHLFEHLFFLDSENLGPGGLDRLMTRVGSSTNGSTNRDRTNYFEVVPVDGLEKALWAEADKLGYFINTVTDSVVAKEKQVVKNEKRQGVDNQPYGHVNFVIDRGIYPEGHPYRWQVIGSLADLDAATLADVKEFHSRWYGPNNATLVVAGDIDVAQTKAWIEKYFGEIPSREMPETPRPEPPSLDESRHYLHEDNYARLPQLTMAWPTVEQYHPDSYPLRLLASLLTDGKTAPFYEVLVEEEQLAPAVRAFNGSQELAGRFTLQVRAYAGKDLDAVTEAIDKAFSRFEEEGVSDTDLQRVKAGAETSFYGGLTSVLGKAFQLAQYNIFADDPGFIQQDLDNLLAVTAADIRRVYESYLKDKPFVAASFVPKGQAELALDGSQRAQVVEEPIVIGAEEEFVLADRGEIPRTPSSFDRSVEPPFGAPPTRSVPEVWSETLANGVAVKGVEDSEIPLVQFELRLRGGLLLEDPEKVGVANLLAQTMTEGTANRTPQELEQAIELLGSSINVSSGRESFTIRGSSLARNFGATMELVEEILLEPRFDADEFELARQRVLNTLRQRSASPNAVATDAYNRLLYGDHILARNALGSPASVEAVSLDDIRAFHARALAPAAAAFHVAGDVSQQTVVNSLAGIGQRWEGAEISLPPAPERGVSRPGVYFVDVPRASQSVLRIGYLALARTDKDFYPARVMNFRLGGGGFASELTQQLREGKGYTYGIGSSFNGSRLPGPFTISSGVRSNVTYEALDLIKQIVDSHGPQFDEADLEATRSFLLRANARAFETLGAKLALLSNMTAYGFAADYVLKEEEIVRNMTVERVRELARQYLDTSAMVWLVVGDAATQMPRLNALGLGSPRAVDRSGEPTSER